MNTKNPQSPQKNTPQKSHRGGQGNKGDPFAIKRSIAEAIKDTQRSTHDIERIKKDKDELIADLADLRIREKEKEEDGLSENVQNLIRQNIDDG